MTYVLEKADGKEFARWWAAYRNTNEDFSQGFAEQYDEIEEVPFCQWIMAGKRRVGGLILVPNALGDFFLIPPTSDAVAVLRDVLPDDQPLQARSILTEHIPAFQMIGFQLEESRYWMLRPAQTFDDIAFSYQRVAPQPAHTQAIAELMAAAFDGGVGQYGKRSTEEHQKSVENYFETIALDELCHQASAVLLDGERLIAACLVQPYKSLASVRFVAVHPAYQRKGIARRLMQHAIHTVHPQYEYVALAVTVGNPATFLYHDMGFVAAPATHTLIR